MLDKRYHEIYIIQLFVKNCYNYLGFDYKSNVIKKSEKPDFVLCHGDDNIGVEITKALDQNLYKAVLIRNNEFKSTSFCPLLFEDKMGSKQIRKMFKNPKISYIGRAYKGDDLEEKIICNIIKAIKRKLKKFDNYEQYKRNILLIHSEDRISSDHNLIINKLKEYVSKNDIRFNYICLKLGNGFHFLSDGEYCFCEIKACKGTSLDSSIEFNG